MATFPLFSKRQKALRREVSDTLTYDVIPQALRVQIIHVLNDAIGTARSEYSHNLPENLYEEIHEVLCREYGIFRLNNNRRYSDAVTDFILDETNTEKVLDAVELCFLVIAKGGTDTQNYSYHVEKKINAGQAIGELNDRFKEHAIGYQYEAGELIRMDSTYIHSQVVKPTLSLIHGKTFSGANEEYLKAHEHYRHGRNKESITECLKAVESVMKIICNKKGWACKGNDTSSKLISICLTNGLVPQYLQTQLTSLNSLLESGIPTIRNRIGGHGQGAVSVTADDEITRYTLNLTGVNLIYLVELSGIK
ncbi:MAG TPA: hypothetical protein VGI43_14825 [Mucilaginibacter sp.]|jgi:hypothetical protein